MTIRVLINGAHGKMGQATINTLSTHPDFAVVGETGRGYDLLTAIRNSKAEVVVDFTNAESVLQNCETIIESGAHPVIGTSGLVKEQVLVLQKKCDEIKLGGIIVPNFSLGAVLMMKLAAQLTPYFPDVEIIEMHHNNKLDAPSGTAIRTAEILGQARNTTPVATKIRETIPGARGATYQNIPIHSIRLPGLVAHQQIIFGGTGETLTIRHDAIDRQSFMLGIILACKKVVNLDKLIYGLEYIL